MTTKFHHLAIAVWFLSYHYYLLAQIHCGLLYHYHWPVKGAHHCSQGWWFPDLGRRFAIGLNDDGTLA